ncbi:outer membrane beta-barrel protein (plasmid) [Thalassobaculum sp. OXR-137]|uniref:outer membrane beta-barrel protein n=1 Tax=Thalassobaculum sp. OXR-137 TaxID=3100173 RepID=UPI002AC9830B|nr:outer membrane beta-barrel protein [Thalassobaculum sp. OXR-137]WPZ37236.1 outer membrane beta-barrel protein [Thalassobaculum sp. OXR-137]
MRLHVICLLAATALSTSLTTTTMAQTRSVAENRANAANITTELNPGDDLAGKNDERRVEESFQPKGVELGQFLLFPSIEVGQEYNSNVFATKEDVRGDFATRVIGKARLRSRFREHALSAGAEVEQYSYWKYTDDSHLRAESFLDGRYDFSKDWEANAFLQAFKRTEDRGSPDDAGGNEPTPIYGLTTRLGTRWADGGFTYGVTGQGDRRIFGDVDTSNGTEINNSDRDRWEYQVTGRTEYEMFPGYAAIAQVSANTRQYDDEFDDDGVDRSSYGFRAYTGIGVDITQVIRGDFLVGYLQQNYDDERLSDPSGPAIKASFNWTPSRITLVVPSIERTVQETTTTNASSIISNRGSLLVRHELQRNIVLTGYAAATYEEFEGVDREDTTYEARARFLWALAPEYYVGGEIGYRLRDSSNDRSSYDQTVATVRLGFRM